MKVFSDLEKACQALQEEAILAKETMYLSFTIYGDRFYRVEYIVKTKDEIVGDGTNCLCKYSPRTGLTELNNIDTTRFIKLSKQRIIAETSLSLIPRIQ